MTIYSISIKLTLLFLIVLVLLYMWLVLDVLRRKLESNYCKATKWKHIYKYTSTATHKTGLTYSISTCRECGKKKPSIDKYTARMRYTYYVLGTLSLMLFIVSASTMVVLFVLKGVIGVEI